jgi:hypothetical protein
MSHFAEIDKNGVVVRVIVAEMNFINSGVVGDSFNWVQTSYNNNFRKNYAGVGYTYDKTRDAFIGPQPYPSSVLNEETCVWESPIAMPDDDKRYDWDEDTTSWKEIE